MKTEKVLQDFVKEYAKGKINGGICKAMTGRYDDTSHFYMTTGYVSWIIQDILSPLDFEKTAMTPGQEKSIKGIYDKAEKEGKLAKLTGKMAECPVGLKKTGVAVEIANDDCRAWINKDFLKTFEKDAIFYISGPTDPVIVAEFGHPAGIILPISPSKMANGLE